MMEPTTMEPTAHALTKAKKLLERNGWRQHAVGQGREPRCIYGAILFVAPSQDTLNDCLDSVAKAIQTYDPNGPNLDIIVWNDQAGRTIADIFAVLDIAIENNS